uniref:Major facilitator superfamily (MFS) profile domain-containing protein n=1 Tax=Favella ehrenbergii TaxID=182087 RepID=A0A7S3I876_9SPIT|mmetsp:Transcript_892/g.1349  ORF Transcript_892/g.1349 Transcript_892/m.1349 type:complete len:161 (+) Transcript_892:548-1030(+)
MGLSMGAVATLAYFKANLVLVVFIVIFLVFFQLTIGTYAWVYLGQVNCDEGLSIGTLVLWSGCLVISIYTQTMFTELHNTWTFLIFASISLASFIFFMLFLRETKGLSRDEAQNLYSKGGFVADDHQRCASFTSKNTGNRFSQASLQQDEDAMVKAKLTA